MDVSQEQISEMDVSQEQIDGMARVVAGWRRPRTMLKSCKRCYSTGIEELCPQWAGLHTRICPDCDGSGTVWTTIKEAC